MCYGKSDGFTTYPPLTAVCNYITYLIVWPCNQSHLPTGVQCISMLLEWAVRHWSWFRILIILIILTQLTFVYEVSVRSLLVALLTAAMVRCINMFKVYAIVLSPP